MTVLTPEAVYQQLGQLVESAPDLSETRNAPETLRWLARAYALVAMVEVAPENRTGG